MDLALDHLMDTYATHVPLKTFFFYRVPKVTVRAKVSHANRHRECPLIL